MDTLFQIIGLLGALFTLAVTILMLFTFRKERRITAFSPLISAVLSLVILPVLILLSGARLNLWLGMPILALGLLVGFLRGLTTQLYYKGEQVVGRHSLFFLLGWGGSLALAQFLNILGSALLASVGLIPVFLSTGTQVGMNANIFLRRLTMRPPAPVPSAGRVQPGLPEQVGPPSPPTPPERARAAGPAVLGLPERRPRASTDSDTQR
jgi:hypothetical protein